MTAEIIDGKQLAAKIRNTLKDKVSKLPQAPKLAVIMVGDDPASTIYVRSKEKACTEIGITAHTYHLTQDITNEELIDLINTLNEDKETNGILVQLPLPNHLDEKRILNTISPLKDVDGFHPQNLGLLIQKSLNAFIPCTPKGIIRLIKSVKENISGLNAVVIGRSQIVGIPTAHLLLNENCTVTITHSKTQNLPDICRQADILIVAIGRSEFVTKEYIKPNAIVIDVGINRTEKGLKGDICFNEVLNIASHVTPVPGGVGPMTIAMLLENTYEAFLKQHHS